MAKLDRSLKLVSALALVSVKHWATKDDIAAMQDNRETLYRLIDDYGWVWDTHRHIWRERVYDHRPSKAPARVMSSPDLTNPHPLDPTAPYTVLVRIIAPAKVMPKVLADFGELLPAIGGEIVTQSPPYSASTGDTWDRVYLKVRFNPLAP